MVATVVRAVLELLEAGEGEPLRFRADAQPQLERALGTLDGAEEGSALSAVESLLGLQVVLVSERSSPSAAELLGRLLIATPRRRGLVAGVEARARRKLVDANARLGKGPAPRSVVVGGGAPARRIAELGSAARELERRRAVARGGSELEARPRGAPVPRGGVLRAPLPAGPVRSGGAAPSPGEARPRTRTG